MAHLAVSNIRSYRELDDWLGKRDQRKIGYRTVAHRYVWRDGTGVTSESIAIRQWSTDIYTITPNNIATLDVGGWFTVTTKDRLNQLLPHPMRIWSERGVWRLFYKAPQYDVDGHYRQIAGKDSARFCNGIQIDVTNREVVANPGMSAMDEQDEHNARIKKLLASYMRGLTPEQIKSVVDGAQTNGITGDCWFCLMTDKNGQTMSDTMNDTEHLVSHLEEHYYMVSLFLNAIKAKGYRDPALILHVGGAWAIRNAVSTYFRKKLLVGVAV